MLAGITLFAAACGNGATENGPSIAAIEITPPSLSLNPGSARPLSATARDAAGSPISVQLFWASADDRIATVSSQGIVTAVAPGRTQVAASRSGISAIVPINVSSLPAGLVRVFPTTATVTVGGTTTLTAEVLDAGGGPMSGQSVAWSSASPSVASVQNGVVTGVSNGTALVSAAAAGLSATAVVTVSGNSGGVHSVTISPATATVQIGRTVQLTAVARDASGNVLTGRSFNWTSSNITRATVVSGLVTGISAGDVTITASTGGKSGTARITVR